MQSGGCRSDLAMLCRWPVKWYTNVGSNAQGMQATQQSRDSAAGVAWILRITTTTVQSVQIVIDCPEVREEERMSIRGGNGGNTRPGDWKCHSFFKNVWASKSVCFFCGAHIPGGGGGGGRDTTTFPPPVFLCVVFRRFLLLSPSAWGH